MRDDMDAHRRGPPVSGPSFVDLQESLGQKPPAISFSEPLAHGSFNPRPPPRFRERLAEQPSGSGILPKLTGASRGYMASTQAAAAKLRTAGSSLDLGAGTARTPKLKQVQVFRHAKATYALGTDLGASTSMDGFASVTSFPRTPRRPATSGLSTSAQVWEARALGNIDHKIVAHSYWEDQWETPIYELPGPPAMESSLFWEEMVYSALPPTAKYEVKIMREIARDKMAGRLGVPAERVEKEAERMFKDCFHELYRRVPVFMLAMKKSAAYRMHKAEEVDRMRHELGEASIMAQGLHQEVVRLREELEEARAANDRAAEASFLPARRPFGSHSSGESEAANWPLGLGAMPVPLSHNSDVPTEGQSSERKSGGKLRRLSSVAGQNERDQAGVGDEQLMDTRSITRKVRMSEGLDFRLSRQPSAMSGDSRHCEGTQQRVAADLAYFDAVRDDAPEGELELKRLEAEYAGAVERIELASRAELPEEELDVMAAKVDSLLEEVNCQRVLVDGGSPEEVEIKMLGVRKMRMDERVVTILRAIDVMSHDKMPVPSDVTAGLNAIQDTLEDMDVTDFLMTLMQAQKARGGAGVVGRAFKRGNFKLTEAERDTVALMQARWCKMEADLSVLEAEVFGDDEAGSRALRRLEASKADASFRFMARRMAAGGDPAAAPELLELEQEVATAAAQVESFHTRRAVLEAALASARLADHLEQVEYVSRHTALGVTAIAYNDISEALQEHTRVSQLLAEAQGQLAAARKPAGREEAASAPGDAAPEITTEPVMPTSAPVPGDFHLEEDVATLERVEALSLCRTQLALMATQLQRSTGDVGKDVADVLDSIHEVTGRLLGRQRSSVARSSTLGGDAGGAKAAATTSGIPLEFSEDGGETFKVCPSPGAGASVEVGAACTHVRIHPPAEVQYESLVSNQRKRRASFVANVAAAGEVPGAAEMHQYSAAVGAANHMWMGVAAALKETAASGDVFALFKGVLAAAETHGVLQLHASRVTCKRSEGGADIEVQRVGGKKGRVTVALNTVDGSAAAALDFEPLSRVLVWEDGEDGAKQVPVRLLADVEGGDSVFAVELTGAGGGALLGGMGRATVCIEDDVTPAGGGGRKAAPRPESSLDYLLLQGGEEGGEEGDEEGDGLGEGVWLAAGDTGQLVYAPHNVVAEARLRGEELTAEGVATFKRMVAPGRVDLPAAWEAFLGASYSDLKKLTGIQVMSLRKLRARIISILRGKMASDRSSDRTALERVDLAAYAVSFHISMYETKRAAKERLREMIISLSYYFRKNVDALVREFAFFCELFFPRPARCLAVYLECLDNLSTTLHETQQDEAIFWSVLGTGRPTKASLAEAISCCVQVFKGTGQEVTSEIIARLKAASASGRQGFVDISELLEFAVDAHDGLMRRALPHAARVMQQVVTHMRATQEEEAGGDDGGREGRAEGAGSSVGGTALGKEDFLRAVAMLAPPDSAAMRLGGVPCRAVTSAMFAAAGKGSGGGEQEKAGATASADACLRTALETLDVTHLLNLDSSTHRMSMSRQLQLFKQHQEYKERAAGSTLDDDSEGGGAGAGGRLFQWTTNSVMMAGKVQKLLLSARESEASSPGALLALAATMGDKEGARKLLEEGAPGVMDSADCDGRTAMHLAASEGNVDVMDLLLAAGAEINPRDRWGNTPLQEAVRCRQALAEHFLRAQGAVGLGQPLVLWHGSIARSPEHVKDALRLCGAVQDGEAEAVRRMLDGGMRADASTYDGRTALHVAAADGALAMVELLVDEYGAFVSPADRWQSTPLTEARRFGHADVVAYLTEHGGLDLGGEGG